LQLVERGYASCHLCDVSFLSLNGILQHVGTCNGYARYSTEIISVPRMKLATMSGRG
jgi:hypothetical protein